MSNGQGHAGAIPIPVLIEHEPRVFVLRPEHYEKDAAIFKTWLDGKSYQGWEVPSATHHFQADGTIVVFAMAIKAVERRVATPVGQGVEHVERERRRRARVASVPAAAVTAGSPVVGPGGTRVDYRNAGVRLRCACVGRRETGPFRRPTGRRARAHDRG